MHKILFAVLYLGSVDLASLHLFNISVICFGHLQDLILLMACL